MLSRFFLDRPVFAWVIAIAMMLAGGLAIYNLPDLPVPADRAARRSRIRAMYPGASAKTVEDSVVQIIEQKMTGLDRMLYMSATSDSSGSAAVTLTFAPGTDPDLAWAKVQNKLQLALPMLPDVVQSRGLTVSKSTRNYLMIVGLTSDDPEHEAGGPERLRRLDGRDRPRARAGRRRGGDHGHRATPCASGSTRTASRSTG